MSDVNKKNDEAALTKPLAIVGIGSMFPKAGDMERFWSNIKHGVDAITEIPDTHWRPEDLFDEDPKRPDFTYGKRGGFIESYAFDPMKYGVPPNCLEATDTSQLLGMVVAESAMDDAGYGLEEDFDRSKVSVILGVTGALEMVIPLGARLGHPQWRKALKDAGLDEATIDDAVQRMSDSYVEWQENSFPGLLGNVVAGRISKYLNTGGTNCVVDAACASSLSALHLAALELETGKADMVITGGTDTFNDIFMYMCFSKTPALSPTGNSKPFADNCDGTILGEGLGMVVMKRLEDAERDGDTIYAVLKGMGSSSDGKGDAIYAPSSPGQKKALETAYKDAGVSPETIELLEAHGTGTMKGDAVEAEALSEVYGGESAIADKPAWCALGSVKSQIGHTKSAAGAAGMIKAALSLHNKVLPPTIKVDQPAESVAPGKTPFYVNTTQRPWVSHDEHPRRAGVSAFGFGGSNFHIVLEEYKAQKSAVDWDGLTQIVAFSADSRKDIEKQVSAFDFSADWSVLRASAKQSREAFEGSAKARLLIVIEHGVTDMTKLSDGLATAFEKNEDTEAFVTREGAYYGFGDVEGKLAYIFPGQGMQFTGMQRDLSCQFPEMLEALEMANEVVGLDDEGQRLSDRIYPRPTFDKDAAQVDTAALTRTNVSQPAIGTVSLGAMNVLKRFGVKPEAAAGHSYGELTALCAAGVLSPKGLIQASKLRGELMASGTGDRGTMLAVRGSLEKTQSVIDEEKLDVIIANKNSPEQGVLSGSTEAINSAKAVFDGLKIRSVPLPVAAAFHSSLVADAAIPFAEGLAEIKFKSAKIPVFSNTTGKPYPKKLDSVRELLANQLANSVEFVDEITAMYESGVRSFLEVGPGGKMIGLVKAILKGKDATFYALDASGGKKSGITDLAKTLSQTAALGHGVDLNVWDDSFKVPESDGKKARMTVPLTGANYRSEQSLKKMNRPATPPRQTAPVQATAISSVPKASMPPLTSNSLAASDSSALGELMQQTQANIARLQQMQQQTAQLHAQFLQGQEEASKTFATLMQQQQQLYQQTGQVAPLASPAPVTAAVPQVQPVSVAQLVPEQSPMPVAASTQNSSDVVKTLLSVVAEKTGYPTDMLELSMSLDSDLGIDSIKRVEILSALQELMPELPTIEAEALGTLETLDDVVNYLDEHGPGDATEASASSAVVGEHIEQLLMTIVAEKTGYPTDMLELGMSLDADLGIDSIKRVEILSALQEAEPSLPTIEAEVLGTLVTLEDVVGHINSVAPVTEATSSVSSASPDTDLIQSALLAIIADKTGYPTDMLEPGMSLDSDLGIDSIKRVEILSALQEAHPELPTIEAEQLGSLETINDVLMILTTSSIVVETLDVKPSQNGVAKSIQDVSKDSIHRQYVALVDVVEDGKAHNLAADAVWAVVGDAKDALTKAVIDELKSKGYAATLWSDKESSSTPQGVIVIAPESGFDDATLKHYFFEAQAASKGLAEGSVFVTVSRMDGRLGFRGKFNEALALTGSLAGLSKTASHEWPSVCSRALDVSPTFASAEEAATAVVTECLQDGPLEVGLSPDGRVSLESKTESIDSDEALTFSSDDVIVVSGGARGVTAEVALAVAQAGSPTLVLLGRSEAPTEESAWLSGIEDEAGIKKAILDHAKGKLTPKELQATYTAIVRNREMRGFISQMEAAGSKVIYRAVDIRNTKEVSSVLEEVRGEYGAITGFIHGAGVLADRFIHDKTPEQFDAVYDTKVAGLRALLKATESDPLKWVTLFSSSTARFGRKGQVDYAMANEVMNKMAQVQRVARPDCKIASVNWGPWAGGMVTPALRKVFESEGIGLIGLDAGAQYLLCELNRPVDGPCEIVILGATGDEAVAAEAPLRVPTDQTPTVQMTLNVKDYPFLKSHVIGGKAVLPVAMYVEWFAHAALHANPGFQFMGIDDVRIFKGLRLGIDESTEIFILSGKPEIQGSDHLVHVTLCSGANAEVMHAKGVVRLGTQYETSTSEIVSGELGQYSKVIGEVYNNGLLFHGETFQGIEAIDGCDDAGIDVSVHAASAPTQWVNNPLRKKWLSDPLIMDCAFQAMILWAFEAYEAGSLPVAFKRFTQFQSSWPKGMVQVRTRIAQHSAHKATAFIEFVHEKSKTLLARIEGYECVIDASLNDAFLRSDLTRKPLKS